MIGEHLVGLEEVATLVRHSTASVLTRGPDAAANRPGVQAGDSQGEWPRSGLQRYPPRSWFLPLQRDGQRASPEQVDAQSDQHYLHASGAKGFGHLRRGPGVGDHHVQALDRGNHGQTALTKLARIQHGNGLP